jgi:cystathionine gamma-synthase
VSHDVKRTSVVRRTPFPQSATTPLAPPIVPSAVFVARDADQMNDIYEGREAGFTYAREGSPNADQLAAKIAALEGPNAGSSPRPACRPSAPSCLDC